MKIHESSKILLDATCNFLRALISKMTSLMCLNVDYTDNMKEPQWNFASSLIQRSTNISPVESLLKFVKGTRVVLEVGYVFELSTPKNSFPPPSNLPAYGIVLLFRQLRVVLTLRASHFDSLFRFRQPYVVTIIDRCYIVIFYPRTDRENQ